MALVALLALVIPVALLAWWPSGHHFQDVDVGGEEAGLVSHPDDGLPLRDIHDKS